MGGSAETRDRTGDLQIFGLTLSQLSYRGSRFTFKNVNTLLRHDPTQVSLLESRARRTQRRIAGNSAFKKPRAVLRSFICFCVKLA